MELAAGGLFEELRLVEIEKAGYQAGADMIAEAQGPQA